MKKIDQKGFSAIEAVLIVIVIGLLAGFGWMIYRSHHNKSSSKTTTQTTQSPSPTPAPSQTTPPPTSTQAYLAIVELGIKLPLADNIKDLKYAYETQDQSTGSTFDHWLDFSSPTIDKDPTCANDYGSSKAFGKSLGQFGVIHSSTQPVIDARDATLEFHTGDIYIYYPHQQAVGCGSDTAAMNKVSQYTGSVIDALKAAQAN